MARWIKANGYQETTRLGVLRIHAGQHFPVTDNPSPKYEVRRQYSGHSIHEEPVAILGRRVKVFYLVNVRPTGKGA